MWLGFRRFRHPFFPALKLTSAVKAGRNARALWGTYAELVATAAAGIRAGRAVLPIRSLRDPFLPEAERNRLWELFGVPIYVLLIDDDRVVGFECEAQEGIHFSEAYPPIISSASVRTVACECGRPGSRLTPPAELEQTGPLSDRTLLAR